MLSTSRLGCEQTSRGLRAAALSSWLCEAAGLCRVREQDSLCAARSTPRAAQRGLESPTGCHSALLRVPLLSKAGLHLLPLGRALRKLRSCTWCSSTLAAHVGGARAAPTTAEQFRVHPVLLCCAAHSGDLGHGRQGQVGHNMCMAAVPRCCERARNRYSEPRSDEKTTPRSGRDHVEPYCARGALLRAGTLQRVLKKVHSRGVWQGVCGCWRAGISRLGGRASGSFELSVERLNQW